MVQHCVSSLLELPPFLNSLEAFPLFSRVDYPTGSSLAASCLWCSHRSLGLEETAGRLFRLSGEPEAGRTQSEDLPFLSNSTERASRTVDSILPSPVRHLQAPKGRL